METKQCKKCQRDLDLNSFRIRRINNYEWCEKTCRECERLKAKEYRNQPDYYSHRKEYRLSKAGNIKFHVQERLSQWKSKTINSDLDSNYLIELYNNQNGLCYYTGEVLSVGQSRGHAMKDSISLDRLIPEKGYVQGNVVWCSYLSNTMKQDLTESDFYSYIRNILLIKDGK